MISYELLVKDRYAEAIEFIIHHFYTREPLGLALGLTLKEVTRWFPSFMTQYLNSMEPLSYLAIDSKNGKLAGAIINAFIDPEKPNHLPSMKQFIEPEKEPVKNQIVKFLESLEHGVDFHKALNQPRSSKVFKTLFLTVGETYQQQGIAKQLLLRSEEKARQVSGVTIAATDTSSFYSYKIFSSAGYGMIKEVEYMSYQDSEGNYIFEGKKDKLGVHTHARVLAKLL